MLSIQKSAKGFLEKFAKLLAEKSRVQLSGRACGEVPGDDPVGDADDVPGVPGEPEVEHGELVGLQRVLEGPAGRVHAMVCWH